MKETPSSHWPSAEANHASDARDRFRRLSRNIANALGTPAATACAMLTVAVWAATGPVFHYSEAWQLIINTGTTIVTFLMVFFIQNTQNRESREIHLKLNEIIRSLKAARNELIDCENMSDEELERLEQDLQGMAQRYGASFTKLHAHVSQTAEQRAKRKRPAASTAPR
jgi:low affinity Fe/Cu permease